MATDPAATELSLAGLGGSALRRVLREAERRRGLSPSRLALRRLRRNRTALAFGVLFLLLVGACLAAPLWADHVAHTKPETNHLTDTIVVDGKRVDVVSPDGIPIGPTWQGEFFFGADDNGRDVMVRLLYGGRNSLLIGVGAALITTLLSVVVGLVAGYFRGWTDGIITRVLDIIWAFPVILLGVALGVALALGGLKLGPISISGDSIYIPMLVIAFVYIPYMSRPLRAQVLSLREKEFVEAARAQGAGPAANHVHGAAAQPGLDDPRVLHPDGRERHPARGGAVVPGRGRAAALHVVGHADRQRHRPDHLGRAPDDRAGDHARAHRAVAERVRRRRARRPRPAREGQAGALMLRFIVRRLISMVFVLFAISVLVFLIFNVIPNGDPAERMAGRTPTETEINRIRAEWGFDESLPSQYVTTMKKVFTGDLVSYFTRLDVVEEIIKGIPAHVLAGDRGGDPVDGHRRRVRAYSAP